MPELDVIDNLDSREVFVLRYIAKNQPMPLNKVSGHTIDHLIAKGLIRICDRRTELTWMGELAASHLARKERRAAS